jgi:hypothetical protein
MRSTWTNVDAQEDAYRNVDRYGCVLPEDMVDSSKSASIGKWIWRVDVMSRPGTEIFDGTTVVWI